MTPQEAAEESKKGVETMHRMHAIADFKKHFEKFRSEPFKSSLLYWMMTGTISGNFAITIDEFTKEMQIDGATAIDTANKIIYKEQSEALSSALKEIAELRAKVKEFEKLISSDSVWTLLRYGYKSPSSSGVDDCEDYDYIDLYKLSTDLKKANRLASESNPEPDSANLPPEVTT